MARNDRHVRGLCLHAGGGSDIVDLEYHLDELGGQLDLGLLAVQGLDDVLALHVAGALLHAVHPQGGVVLRYLNYKIILIPIFNFYIVFTGLKEGNVFNNSLSTEYKIQRQLELIEFTLRSV